MLIKSNYNSYKIKKVNLITKIYLSSIPNCLTVFMKELVEVDGHCGLVAAIDYTYSTMEAYYKVKPTSIIMTQDIFDIMVSLFKDQLMMCENKTSNCNSIWGVEIFIDENCGNNVVLLPQDKNPQHSSRIQWEVTWGII